MAPGAEDFNEVIIATVKVLLYDFVRSVRVTDQHEESFLDDLIQAAAHLWS
jgi:hypothetical protein